MLTVATLMRSKPETVRSDMTLIRLERLFLTSGYTGFPVVDGGRLVGVVSRSDIVRSILAERSRVEQVSDFYRQTGPVRAEDSLESLEKIAAQVGVRTEALCVKDVMIQSVVSIGSRESITTLAEMMYEGHLHRLPVVEDDRLVGLVTSMDLVRAIHEGRLTERDSPIDSDHLIA